MERSVCSNQSSQKDSRADVPSLSKGKDDTVHVSYGRMEETQEMKYGDNARDPSAISSTNSTDQRPRRRTYRDIPITPEATPPPLKRNKRAASSDLYRPLSPVSLSSINRKSSMEKGLTSLPSDMDPAILSATESTRDLTISHSTLAAGSSSLPDFSAHQFASHPAAHSPHSGYWNSLPTPNVQPQLSFSSYSN